MEQSMKQIQKRKTIVLDVDGVYLTFELAANQDSITSEKKTASLEGTIKK